MNNKIISSILAVIMCCQLLVGATEYNSNSDNREFVLDKGIDNNPAVDGFEEKEEEEEDNDYKDNRKNIEKIKAQLKKFLKKRK